MSPQERTKPSFNLYNILDTGLIDKIITGHARGR